MTNTHERESVEAQLEESARICDAATKGPCRAQGFTDEPGDWGVPILGGGTPGSMDEHLIAYTMTYQDQERTEADAKRLVHSWNALPQRNAALKAVLELHKPYRGPGPSGRPDGVVKGCVICGPDSYSTAYFYPCATVRAIEEAS